MHCTSTVKCSSFVKIVSTQPTSYDNFVEVMISSAACNSFVILYYFLLIVLIVVAPTIVHGLVVDSSSSSLSSRRSWLRDSTAGILAVVTSSSPNFSSQTSSAVAADDTTYDYQRRQQLPDLLREVSFAPSPSQSKNINNGSKKSTGLSLHELAGRLTNDLTIGATNRRGGYFVTGDLSPDIFRDDCIFSDPTNKVSSLSKYRNALRILFDPDRSSVELLGQGLSVNEAAMTISGRIRSRGYLQLPWHPRISTYETDVTYFVDADGLIERQDQIWIDKTPYKALQETVSPSFFDPPPRSNRAPPVSNKESIDVSVLFERVNGRRPDEYTQRERVEISRLIDTIVASSSSKSKMKFDVSLLPGTWNLVFIQPGPDGSGIDRRIPFPEFSFNDSFQIFTNNVGNNLGVINVGQVFGPWIDVKVSGKLREENPKSKINPKRFVAEVDGGRLCFAPPSPVSVKRSLSNDSDGGSWEGACVDLPIRGEGIFDSLYLSERLRIGQNINGGGARIVQIRL